MHILTHHTHFQHVIAGIIDPDDNTGPDAPVGAVTYEGHDGQHFTLEHRYDMDQGPIFW